MTHISVIVPAFLEEKTIQSSVTRLLDVLQQLTASYEVVVVVDGSPDNTYTNLKNINSGHLKIVNNPMNLGKGASLKIGIDQTNCDYVAFVDADMDIDVSCLLSLYQIISRNECDAVVGSKVHPQSNVSYPKARRVLSYVYRFFVRQLFDLNISDTQTGMKIFKYDSLKSVINNCVISGFAFDLELLVLMHRRNYVIKEAPINLNYKFTSTISIKASIRAMIDLIVIYFRHKNLKVSKH